MTKPNIDKLKKEFFYKNISVGYHNRKYTRGEVVQSILQLCKHGETIGEYCTAPSSDTLYRRLKLEIKELVELYQEVVFPIAEYYYKMYPREKWEIILDPTDEIFYGKKGDEYDLGTENGEECFRFGQIIIACRKIRIPVAIFPIKRVITK